MTPLAALFRHVRSSLRLKDRASSSPGSRASAFRTASVRLSKSKPQPDAGSPEESRSHDDSIDFDSPFNTIPRYSDAFESFSDDVMIKACARAVANEMKPYLIDAPDMPDDVFDERLGDVDGPALAPNRKNIQTFIRRIMRCTGFELSVLVATLSLFKRVVKVINLTEFSWRLALFITMDIAQKLVDDFCILKASQLEGAFRYATDLADFPLGQKTLHRLEGRFLNALKFRVCVDVEWDDAMAELKRVAVDMRC